MRAKCTGKLPAYSHNLVVITHLSHRPIAWLHQGLTVSVTLKFHVCMLQEHYITAKYVERRYAASTVPAVRGNVQTALWEAVEGGSIK